MAIWLMQNDQSPATLTASNANLALMFRMRLPFVASLAGALVVLTFIPANSASIAGTNCTKVSSTKIISNIKYTCIKSGKKFVWNKGVKIAPAPTPSKSAEPTPTPTPTLSLTPKPTPTYKVIDFTWENLYENRANISYTVWKRSAEIIAANKSKLGSVEIHTGPNTVQLFSNVELALTYVSRLFPLSEEPKKVLFVQYNYQDLKWADDLVRSKISAQEYEDLNRNEGGKLLTSNCREPEKVCNGSKQQTSASGLALILQGVIEKKDLQYFGSPINFTTGLLEAHEYFHALQRIPLMFKNIPKWPKTWFREGGATWVQNAAINHQNYNDYVKFLKTNCDNRCTVLSYSDIERYLETADSLEVTPGFEQHENYWLWSLFVESLIALSGPQTLMDLYVEVGRGQTFEAAFEKIYGKTWESAKPIIAKIVYSNLYNQ